MKNKRVFVSGGAGVIGLEMIPRLIERGAKVFVGDLKPRPECFSAEVYYRQGDLNSLTQLELDAFSPNVFIHLAATFERTTESYDFWDENFWHNIRLSHHLMTVIKDLPSLERVVFASSYLIYDPAQYQFDKPRLTPISLNEKNPVLPRNLTGMAKFAHEVELRFLDGFKSQSFTTVCARIFRGYGRNSRDVISRWIRVLLDGKPISVYRSEGLFDYIYASDSAEGLIRLADEGAVSGIINLGTGKARRVKEIVDILQKYFPDMQVVEEETDILYEASEADMSWYRAAVGWVPEIDLEEAIPEIISHEKAKRATITKSKHELGSVLVTSVSKKVPLVQAVKMAARKLNPDIQLIAGDMDEGAIARFVADDFWKMPCAVDANLDVLVAGCEERGIRTIIPTRDGELLFWAQNKSHFSQEGIDVVVSQVSSIQVCIDKLGFARFGEKHNLPFIPSGSTPDEVGKGPYVVKERYGSGARRIGLNLDLESSLEHARMLEVPIYQPFITGQEISIDAWLDHNHAVKGLILRTRDRVINGESQVTSTFRDTRVEAKVKKVLQVMKLRGPVVMQAIIDSNRDIHVIECNARFGGASTISIAAGLDIFYWSLLESCNVDVSAYPYVRVHGEIRQIRIPDDLYIYGDHF